MVTTSFRFTTIINAVKYPGPQPSKGTDQGSRWISYELVDLLDACRSAHPGAIYNVTHKALRRQLAKRLKNDRGQPWIAILREIEKSPAIGDKLSTE